MIIACVFIKTETIETMQELTSPLIDASETKEEVEVHLAMGEMYQQDAFQHWCELSGQLAAYLLHTKQTKMENENEES